MTMSKASGNTRVGHTNNVFDGASALIKMKKNE